MNENHWFQLRQGELLKMVNTDFGRDLLCIPKEYPRIVEISKKHVTCYLGRWNNRDHFLSDFRVGAKWGNIIRNRWQEYQSYRRYFQNDSLNVSPLTRYALSVVAATDTYYPDPDAETTTVDGDLYCDDGTGNLSWATIRASTVASSAAPSAAASNFNSGKHAATDYRLVRNVYLFDTSSITDTDTIDSGTFESTATNITFIDTDTLSFHLTSSNPASNTNLVVADYDITKFGSTSFGSKTWASYTRDGSTYNAITLNASGLSNVSKTGVSKFGLRSSSDFNNTEPTAANAMHQQKFADTATTAADPKLVITHSAAAATSRLLLLLGVGT